MGKSNPELDGPDPMRHCTRKRRDTTRSCGGCYVCGFADGQGGGKLVGMKDGLTKAARMASAEATRLTRRSIGSVSALSERVAALRGLAVRLRKLAKEVEREE